MAQEAKKGWFGGMFKPKPIEEVIGNVARDLDISIKVDNNATPTITIASDARTIATLEKALEREGVKAATNPMHTKLVFEGEAQVEKITKQLDKVNRYAAKIDFQRLKERVSFEDMEGVSDRDLKVISMQGSPNISMVGSIARMVVRDRQDALAEMKPKKAAPKAAPKAAASKVASKAAQFDDDMENVLAEMMAADEVDREARMTQDWSDKKQTAAISGAAAAVTEAAMESAKKEEPAAQSMFEDDDMSFSINTTYTVKKRSGPAGGLVVALPPGTDEGTWMDEVKELRQAAGDSGIVSVQRYQNPNKPDSKGFIIAGIDADKLVAPDSKSVSKDSLMRRIASAARAEERFVETGTTEKLKTASFSFPKELSAQRRQEFVADLRESFGEQGAEHIKEYESKGEFGFKIIGATREELTADGGPINNKALQAKLAEMADAIRSETPLSEMPDTSKSAVLLFPKDLPQERRESYIEQLRELYAENGERIVREFRSRGDLEKTGVKIVGVTKEELLAPEKKSINNKVLLQKLNDIVNDSHAEVASPMDQEPAAGAVVVSSDAQEMVAAFMKEVRQNMRAHDQKRKELKESLPETEALEAIKVAAKEVPSSMTFPENSQMLIIRNIPKGENEMLALRSAFNEQGYNTAIVGQNKLYINLQPKNEKSHAERLTAGDNAELAEQNLRALLEPAFKPNEVESLTRQYQARNKQQGMQVSGG